MSDDQEDNVIKTERKPCYVCGKDSNIGVSFCNSQGINFTRLPLNERAHMECYIDYCVKAAIEEQVVRKD